MYFHHYYHFTALCLGLYGWAGTRRNITHSHLSWLSIILYLLPPSTMIHSILPFQFMCLTVFLHNLCLRLLWTTSWFGTIHFILQWLSFRNTCPYQRNLFCWAICKSAHHQRQITMPAPHHSVFHRLDALLATQPTALKYWRHYNIQQHNTYNWWSQCVCANVPCSQFSKKKCQQMFRLSMQPSHIHMHINTPAKLPLL